MAVEAFDHTGDLGVRISAPTRDELFAEAAAALTDVIADLGSVEARDTARLSLTSPELELLLRDFLSELLFRFDAHGFLTRRADVAIDASRTPLALEARLHGEPLDPSRHGVKVLVKAVTYHGLKVEHGGHGWRATVIFDI